VLVLTFASRETDEVRSASSLTLGIIIQNFVTVLAALALAFRGSWSLTLVIFSTIPLIMIIQSFAQNASTPLLTVERNVLAQCADHCDRSFSSISTVKAFNAEDRELDQLEYFLEFLQKHQIKLYMTWGFTTALSQFVVMSTFVTGFWFGSFLVRTGHSTPGGVMGVFWACLIATNNLQLVLPHFVTLSRGMAAMVSLRTLIEAPIPPRPELPPPDTLNYDDVPRSSKMVALPNLPQSSFRKIVPDQPAKGEFMLQNVTFAYPTRPLQSVLRDVSIFIPPNETTFIVGASGSGKSTIAALLTRLYTPQYGSIIMDDQELSHLAVEWTRSHIFHVSQTCVLFPGSIAHNVAMGLAGSPYRQPGEESRAEVIAACRASLLHEFIRDELPEGYDTEIGNTGDLLSGGQKQRLAIARARLRDPTVLILGKISMGSGLRGANPWA
jgi:ATP-binding cassette subfamily B (MDR/TAP) protein 1